MMSRYKNLLKLLTIILLCSFVGGCVSLEPTMPNGRYSGPYPSELNAFADKNSLLANELVKLPEFQDGISEEEVATLEKLLRVYDDNPDAFDRAFERMYQVGIPEVRKFCSPLQASFWISQQNIDGLKPLIENYNLKKLLDEGWRFYKPGPLWKDPVEIIDRLNAPELVQYWFVRNFMYDWSKFWVTAPSALPQSVKRTIKTKKGVCYDAAYVAYTCLKRAGYDATGLNVYYDRRATKRAAMHSVCIFKANENSKIVYYKLTDTSYRRHIEGPFRTIKAVAEKVAFRAGVSVGTYTTGIPEYHWSLVKAK